ncbi:MAG: DUF4153 domain-containing protein [Sporolactobacillus sp.]
MALASFLVLNYFPVDYFIAQKNIERYRLIGKINFHYLSTLSADAVPAIIPLLSSKDVQIRHEAAKSLQLIHQSISDPRVWQSANLSNIHASALLDRYVPIHK